MLVSSRASALHMLVSSRASALHMLVSPQVIEDFETQMKEAVNEEHEGKRKNELAWKIHRLHWEKNRFIFDLMYQRKVMSRELVRALAEMSAGTSLKLKKPLLCRELAPASPELGHLLG